MLHSRTLKILALLLAAYALVVVAAHWGPPGLQETAGVFVLVPLLSVYLFHKLGVPGLLEHNGLCGWGWCNPTAFGWAFTALLWLVLAWLLAWGLAGLASRWGRRP